MKKYILVFIASIMAMAAMAETLTPQQERKFYVKAYDIIKIYAQSAKLSDERDLLQFSDLFERSDAQICNDLMGLSYEYTLPVSDYVKLLREADMVKIAVKNVQKVGDVTKEGDVWQMSIAFDKNISFVSQCNTLFDSHDFFKKDYRMVMTLVWDGEDECYIRDIQAVGEMLVFPEDYRVLVKTDERDNNLDIDGIFVKFQMDQKILKPEEVLYYRKAKVQEKEMNDGCDHKVYAIYHDKTWRIRLGGSFALSGFNKLGKNTDITTSKDGETAFGVDFGYMFRTNKHLQFGVFAGIGMSKNGLMMEYMPKEDELSIEGNKETLLLREEDGDSYIRKYDFGNSVIKQELKATDIAVPLYADIEYQFNSRFSAYADLGVKFQMSSGKMTTTTGGYYVWGLYEQYNNLEIGKPDENGIVDVIVNNFGYNDKIDVDDEGITQSMVIDLLCGLGLRINLSKSFAIDAGVQYQAGTKSWKSNGKELFNYTLADKDRVNLLHKAGDISHNSIKISASVIYKF